MKVVAQNRRARFDYEIVETVEAGLVLTGPEVKSCRAGRVSLAGSYVTFRGDSPLLKNAKIVKYDKTGPDVLHEEGRDRPLLLKKSELQKLQRTTEEKGMSLIPLELRSGKFIKVLLGVAKGRKKGDKRQVIKDRDTKRRMREGREV
jgi:SsrA-binding protein